jgi:hypothetical protein
MYMLTFINLFPFQLIYLIVFFAKRTPS